MPLILSQVQFWHERDHKPLRAEVKQEEQPFGRVKLIVEMARKRKGVNRNFDFDESIL